MKKYLILFLMLVAFILAVLAPISMFISGRYLLGLVSLVSLLGSAYCAYEVGVRP